MLADELVVTRLKARLDKHAELEDRRTKV